MARIRSILLTLYRLFQRTLVKKMVLPLFLSKKRLKGTNWSRSPSFSVESPKEVLWYHAASAGELETLWPLILLSIDQGYALVVTVWSESAARPLEKLVEEIMKRNGSLLFSGFSPLEGEWKVALGLFKPKYFITARYEAWPDLWISLVQSDIPLGIISARVRRSLKVAKIFCTLLTGKLPCLNLFTSHEFDLKQLETLFPEASKLWVGDPRWDQVHRRWGLKQPRVEVLRGFFHASRRPWGLLGSVWPSDLEILGPGLSHFLGTLWIVPHQIDHDNVIHLEKILTRLGFTTVRTSTLNSDQSCKNRLAPRFSKRKCILVDEMGYLAELYGIADWAYVGGGFGDGIHSVIEPCFHGKSICIGPEGTHRFPEVSDLQESGQLTVLKNSIDFEKWLKHVEERTALSQHQWIREALLRLGASQKIVETIEKKLQA